MKRPLAIRIPARGLHRNGKSSATGFEIYNSFVRTFTVRTFNSFEQAERADKAYYLYLSLTPSERLRIMCELLAL